MEYSLSKDSGSCRTLECRTSTESPFKVGIMPGLRCVMFTMKCLAADSFNEHPADRAWWLSFVSDTIRAIRDRIMASNSLCLHFSSRKQTASRFKKFEVQTLTGEHYPLGSIHWTPVWTQMNGYLVLPVSGREINGAHHLAELGNLRAHSSNRQRPAFKTPAISATGHSFVSFALFTGKFFTIFIEKFFKLLFGFAAKKHVKCQVRERPSFTEKFSAVGRYYSTSRETEFQQLPFSVFIAKHLATSCDESEFGSKKFGQSEDAEDVIEKFNFETTFDWQWVAEWAASSTRIEEIASQHLLIKSLSAN